MPNINFKKLWRRRSADLSDSDLSYKVVYLGNVLTGWAKGDGCVEKPLATLWRNYCQSSRHDIAMQLKVCSSGLQATTKEHGLTEYWAHRLTYCVAHPAYPKVFCWVYRHEGRRLKQELRCHAVICSKKSKAKVMESLLKEKLSFALHEFRREKFLRQNARLSVVNAAADTTSVPTRKVFLVNGTSNYRPPLERSKSAPKLGPIEELSEEDDEEYAITGERVSADSRVAPPDSRVTLTDIFSRLEIEKREDEAAVVQSFNSNISVSYNKHASKTNSTGRSSTALTFLYNDNPRPPPAPDISPPDSGCNVENSTSFDSYSEARISSFVEESACEGGESLTSDQPESLGSHSCSSSCTEDTADDLLISENGVVLSATRHSSSDETPSKSVSCKEKEDEDNISEESGYSEDKEALPPIIKV